MSRPDPAAAYLAAFRRSVAQPEGARERNLDAIERRLAEGDHLVDDVTPPRPVTGRWAAAVLVMKSLSLSLALGGAGLGAIKLGAMGWSAATAAPVERPEPAEAEVDAPAESAPARTTAPAIPPPAMDTAATPAPPPEPAPVPAATPAAPETKQARKRELVAPTPTGSIQDRLREEVQLMQRAQAELEAGRYAKLLELVAEHKRRFPDGAMLEERQAWQAIGACGLGHADGQQKASAFVRRHPRSSLASKVQRACDRTIQNKVTEETAPRDAGSR